MPGFAAEILGIDVGELAEGDVGRLRAALLEHKLIVLRGQRLDPAGLVAFARRLGEPEAFDEALDSGLPEVMQITGEPGQSTPPYWHSDGMVQPEPPSATLFYAKLAAPGTATLFLDAQQAYADFPEELRAEIQDLRARLYNGVEQPLVRRHPETGAPALYFDFGSTVGLAGLDRDAAAGLFARLRDHFNAAPAYRHETSTGDLLIWDNACTSHSATRPKHPDEPKLMLRVTLRGPAAA